jgi:hypothetical protein
LQSDVLQFFATLATVLGSISGAYALWSRQQFARSSKVERLFKEIFRSSSGYIDSIGTYLSTDAAINPVLKDREKCSVSLNRKPRPLRPGLEELVPMSDDDILLEEALAHVQWVCPEAIEALTKALEDYEDLKQILPDLEPDKASEILNIRRLAGQSLSALQILRAPDVATTPSRWLDFSLEAAQIETLRGAFNDWMHR